MSEHCSKPKAGHALCGVLNVFHIAEGNLERLIAFIHELALHLLELGAHSLIRLHISLDKSRAFGVDLLVEQLVLALDGTVGGVLLLVEFV